MVIPVGVTAACVSAVGVTAATVVGMTVVGVTVVGITVVGVTVELARCLTSRMVTGCQRLEVDGLLVS